MSKFMDLGRASYYDDAAQFAQPPGIVIKYSLLIAALLVLVTGCAGTEPRPRAGSLYSEEIKSPAPRGDTLMFDPNCIVR